jgi:DNA polymerase I-like protein with 3'-5' exonuclease and polymerase domains
MDNMKIAVVEKNKTGYSDPYREYFNFDYDRFQLVNSNKTKILKRDITLDENFEDYDLVVLVGADPCKHIGKITNVTKYAGHLVKDKYIPMLNPVAVKFNPGIKDTLEGALKKLHDHIDGSYQEVLGDYEGITCARRAKEWILEALRYKEHNYIVADIETSSLYPRSGYVLGIALSYKTLSGVYIESDCIDEKIEGLLQELFNKKVVIFHNAKFDMQWLIYHFNFKFPTFRDTMLEHYLLNENEPHDLKFLAMKYTSMGDYDFELEAFKKSYCKSHGIYVRDFSYEYIPFEIMVPYACADADGTMRLHNKFSNIVDKHFKKPYNDIMLRGTQFLMEIEETGVPFSKEHLNEANKTFTKEILELTDDLYKYPEIHEVEKEQGTKFNPNSPAQLVNLLFDKLNLPTGRKTDGGAYSTDKDELERLASLHSIPAIISEIRQKVKLRSTYITKVLKGLDFDGRLRAGFHLHTVTSGRLSSSGKLNMQQLPRDDKTVKNCIRSTDPDWVIFSQDLQTAEMYYAAALSGDRNLAQVFINGEDFHSSIAKMVFNLGCPTEDIAHKYPDLRQACKAISFGILYGAGAAKISSEVGISYNEAKNIIRRYFKQYNQLEKWIERTQEEITANGYIYSAFGRKRRVPNVFSLDDYEQGHALRSAMNFTVQSVASDVNLLSAMDAHDYLKKKNIPAKIFGLVHDSIIGECHKGRVDQLRKVLLVATQKDRGVSISQCPIKVDFGYGESYAKAA